MQHFIAYHNVDEEGKYRSGKKGDFRHFSNKPKSMLEAAIDQTIWVVTGELLQGTRKSYHLVGKFRAEGIDENLVVFGRGESVKPPIELTRFEWFPTLRIKQGNFSLGLNEIKSDKVIAGLIAVFAGTSCLLPGELAGSETFTEGAVRQVFVNAYERNPQARAACLSRYGFDCAVCKFNFAKVYGEIGEGFIHVHHLRSITAAGREYEVDPVKDLRPVCPNCHAMLHKETPPMSIEKLRKIIKQG